MFILVKKLLSITVACSFYLSSDLGNFCHLALYVSVVKLHGTVILNQVFTVVRSLIFKLLYEQAKLSNKAVRSDLLTVRRRVGIKPIHSSWLLQRYVIGVVRTSELMFKDGSTKEFVHILPDVLDRLFFRTESDTQVPSWQPALDHPYL